MNKQPEFDIGNIVKAEMIYAIMSKNENGDEALCALGGVGPAPMPAVFANKDTAQFFYDTVCKASAKAIKDNKVSIKLITFQRVREH